MVLSSMGAILLLGFLFVFVSHQPLEISKNKEATVVIDYGNGKTRTFKGSVGESLSVWDAFQQAIAAGGINVEISDHFLPEAIDGFKNDSKGKSWSFYLNNVRQEFSPFGIRIRPGDEIIFRFE